jgi:hypothetical protein
MTTYWKELCEAAFLAAAFSATTASAQDFAQMMAMQGAGKPAISASGNKVIQRKPTQLRLYVQLIVKGKTLEEALAKLKERQEAATTQLESLKADKKTILFGAPSMATDQSSARRRQVQALVIQQMKARGKKVPKGLLNPQTVTVSATLTAYWPLGDQSSEKLLILSQGIQEKIKAADLSGSKEVEKLTPEEEEFEEEASQMSNQMGDESQPQPGQPQFLFAAVLPKAERQKGMAEAFAKAKTEAAELAKAAGVELGPLVGLSGGCSGQAAFGESPFARYGGYNNPNVLPQMIAEQSGESSAEQPEGKPDEALGTDPSALKFTCAVSAMFQLGK